MPAGFEVFDMAGNNLVSITSRLARFIGSTQITGDAGSIFNATLMQGEAFYSFQQDFLFGYIDNDISRPIFSYANGVISWSYSPAQGAHNKRMTGWLFYGVR